MHQAFLSERVNDFETPGLPDLSRLPVGRHALLEHPFDITLGGETSTSETPNAR